MDQDWRRKMSDVTRYKYYQKPDGSWELDKLVVYTSGNTTWIPVQNFDSLESVKMFLDTKIKEKQDKQYAERLKKQTEVVVEI